jgi:hypothetical protein
MNPVEDFLIRQFQPALPSFVPLFPQEGKT